MDTKFWEACSKNVSVLLEDGNWRAKNIYQCDSVNKVVLTCISALVGFLRTIVLLVYGYEQVANAGLQITLSFCEFVEMLASGMW